jgi:hypothetical protein
MAGFNRVHGNSNGVVNVDIQDADQTSVGVPINVAGPKLDFFSIDLNDDISGQLGTGGAVEAVIKTIQQKGVVYFYQATNPEPLDDNQYLSVAVYPVGAWTTDDLYDAIESLGTVNGFDLSNLDNVESHGFALENYC